MAAPVQTTREEQTTKACKVAALVQTTRARAAAAADGPGHVHCAGCGCTATTGARQAGGAHKRMDGFSSRRAVDSDSQAAARRLTDGDDGAGANRRPGAYLRISSDAAAGFCFRLDLESERDARFSFGAGSGGVRSRRAADYAADAAELEWSGFGEALTTLYSPGWRRCACRSRDRRGRLTPAGTPVHLVAYSGRGPWLRPSMGPRPSVRHHEGAGPGAPVRLGVGHTAALRCAACGRSVQGLRLPSVPTGFRRAADRDWSEASGPNAP